MMKLRNAFVGLALVLATGCDTMEQDADGQMLSINNEPAYLLADTDGIIDLPSRIVSPGKVKVEVTGTTSNGALVDLGQGLLRYSPSRDQKNDSFSFRVFSTDNKVIGESNISIIVGDTTNVPCAVYTKNDSVYNVTGPVTVDVTKNDWSCGASLFVSIGVSPRNGTATIVGNKIQYTPGATFTGRDQLMYLAQSGTHKAYGMLFINGGAPADCHQNVMDDLFYKPLNDTSLIYLDVLANDTLCTDSLINITYHPTFGYAFVDNVRKKIGYRNFPTSNSNDTVLYVVGSSNKGRVIIKRQ